MELFMRVAFWIFTFSVTLSGCFPSPNIEIPIEDFNIDFINESVICDENSKFYTPSTTDKHCATTALRCILEELKGTARRECDDPEHRIDQGLESLEMKIEQLKDDAPAPGQEECICEKWSETPFSNFMDNYKKWLQMINSGK